MVKSQGQFKIKAYFIYQSPNRSLYDFFGLKYFLGMFSSLSLFFLCANERCSGLNVLFNKIFENEQIWGVLVFRN